MTVIRWWKFLLVPVVTVGVAEAFAPGPTFPSSFRSAWNLPSESTTVSRTFLAKKEDDSDDAVSSSSTVEPDMNPLTRASWYAVEAFGKAFGSKNKDGTVDGTLVDQSKPPQSLAETLDRIQLDNDRSYFLSGEVDRLIYDEDCVFSDPFVSFSGRDRFVDNLANLGSFITNYSAKMLDYDTSDSTTVKTRVMVKLELNLPWKPVLAWPWGVTYTIDPDTFLITNHGESWDIEPLEGVKQIFRKPTVKIT